MRSLLLYVFILVSGFLSAQISFDKTKHDFGDLEPYSARYVDFILTNTGNKQEWLLSVKKPYEVVYINSNQFIEKDSSIVLRLQVNPKEKGRFNYKVEVFTSDRNEAVEIKLTGNLSEAPETNTNSFTACPNFDDRPGGRDPNSFDLTVVTVDKETREELSKSAVRLIQNGRVIWTKVTDRNGKIKENATLGLSYFYAVHEGYKPAELGAYINFKRNYVILELERDPEPVIIEEPVDTNDVVVVEIEPEAEEIEIEIEIEEELAQEETTPIVEELPPALEELEKDNFDDEYFKPVNVVFVLDVSSSMKQVDKLELMKYSLYQLVDMLRSQDKIGIVTYSSNAQVMLKPTSGADKEKINEEVGDLKAFGFTAGGLGIKMGFKQAKRGYIEGGVNHVIVITDGAFNRQSQDYKKYVRRYAKKGIHMSVVGIKNKSVDEEEMREAAELGGGHFIPIQKLSDAQQNLNQAIRLLTFRY